MTDGQGRTIDFRNTLIVLTSNLGSEYLAHAPEGTSEGRLRDQVMEAVRGHFRTEFLKRLDEIMVFHRLGRHPMKVIVHIQLRRVRKYLAEPNTTIHTDTHATPRRNA